MLSDTKYPLEDSVVPINALYYYSICRIAYKGIIRIILVINKMMCETESDCLEKYICLILTLVKQN